MPGPLCVTSLRLAQFRSHAQAQLAFDGRPVAIWGPNGAGKTNLIEAVSLLPAVEGVGHVTFGHADVVRHDLVRRIVKAYEDAGGIHQRREM